MSSFQRRHAIKKFGRAISVATAIVLRSNTTIRQLESLESILENWKS